MIWSAVSSAAGLLLLFGLWQLSAALSVVRVTSANGSHTSYILPDGSEVQLNAASRITFKKKNFTSERLVNLEGEAFFNVMKGNAFRINTTYGSVVVLGTSFNVFSRYDSFKVTCITGEVMVTSNNQVSRIGQGESAELSGENLKSYRDSKLRYVTGWINGEFYFENTPLNLVFDEIERQFNVKFAGREKESGYYTGGFNSNDLNRALELVCLPMGLNYEIEANGKIFISNKK
jgi:ferric-dicitrate binding protein FerR (iron transport regulator)